MRSLPKTNVVPRVLAILFAAQWITLQGLVKVQGGLQFLDFFWMGNDFTYLYNGAGFFLSGTSPYREPNFIPLPSALYLPILLHRLEYWDAFTAFRAVNLILILGALLWLCRGLRISAANTALIFLITISYGPFYSLLAGGNLDGLMLAFLVFSCARRVPVRGVFLGLSIATKFYSLLLVPLLLVKRRWKELLWVLGTIIVLLVPFSRYLSDAFGSVFHRTSALRIDGNESPAVLFIELFGANRSAVWKGCYLLLWGGTLALRIAADLKLVRSEDKVRFENLRYLPWMAAAPLLVFTYTATILLPLVVLLTNENQERSLRWSEWLTVSGIALSGFYATLSTRLLESLPTHLAASTVKGIVRVEVPLALSLILLGTAASGWTLMRAPNRGGSGSGSGEVQAG